MQTFKIQNRFLRKYAANGLMLFSLFLVIGCSPQLNPGKGGGNRVNSSPHLKFETDALSDLIRYQGFVVRYDYLHRVPTFVIHRITPQQLSDSAGIKAKRSNRFWVDKTRLVSKSATSDDYRKSGFDRGHHAPAGDFVYSQELKDESFVYSNISPQKAGLNRGPLAKIERQIREKAEVCKCRAYVITGTHFESNTSNSIGSNQVGVPDYVYKLVYYPKTSHMFAFLLDNRLGKYPGDLSQYQKTVDDIEALTQEDFFDRLDDALEDKLEKKRLTFQSENKPHFN
ncbi:MAG: DNA/RNA non-specific endonuclease [Roseivirga sp.]|nr:DNA/RNA non-specific endonuclease [Roseivirga sp.]